MLITSRRVSKAANATNAVNAENAQNAFNAQIAQTAVNAVDLTSYQTIGGEKRFNGLLIGNCGFAAA